MYIPDSLSRSLFSVHLSMYLLQKEYGFVRVASDQEHRHEREIIADSLFSLSLSFALIHSAVIPVSARKSNRTSSDMGYPRSPALL